MERELYREENAKEHNQAANNEPEKAGKGFSPSLYRIAYEREIVLSSLLHMNILVHSKHFFAQTAKEVFLLFHPLL